MIESSWSTIIYSAAAGLLSLGLPTLMFARMLRWVARLKNANPASMPIVVWAMGVALKWLTSIALMALSIRALGAQLNVWAFLCGLVIAAKLPIVFALLRLHWRRHVAG